MWRKRKKAGAVPSSAPGAAPRSDSTPPPPPPDQGPRRVQLSDGVVIEDSAATGRSFLVPADPRPKGVDVRPAAPGWAGLDSLCRRLGGR
jgi:hypothetical protein